jgi:hypothetical protein
MAAAEEIAEVRGMLGPNSVAEGWTDERIGAELDAGDSPNTIARKYWESRMASTTNLADVSESGSSRRLQQIFSNNQSMAAYFRGREAAEDPENQPGNFSFVREMRRQ